MNPRDDHRQDAELLALTQAYCDGDLDAAGVARLERRLLDDAAARAFFRRYLALDAALLGYGTSAARHWEATESLSLTPSAQQPEAPARKAARPSPAIPLGVGSAKRRRFIVAATLTATAAAVAVWALASFNRNPGDAAVIATLEQVAGEVHVLAADGQVRAIVRAAPLRPGDTVRTRGVESSTVVAYPDGTRLTLTGDTAATCGQGPAKNVVIHEGMLAASVRPQPRGAPMRLTTPTAQVQVLGTQFLIEAGADRTDLRVTRGRVRLVRVSDGRAVEVSDGKQVAVTARAPLRVEETPTLTPAWEADFEDGLPAGWDRGEHVTQGLPPGSRGAVKAVRDESDGDLNYAISSPTAWSQGLFAVGKDSHLHVTFKMEHPDWLNLFLITRTSAPQEPRFAGNFIFKEFPKVAPGQWLTISIPLTEFKQVHLNAPPLEQLTPYKVTFSAAAPDRGLVIDRIWVTPDGPGYVAWTP